MITVGVTYAIVTPESALDGDADEMGWEFETEVWRPGALRELLDGFHGSEIEASCSEIHQGMWWTAYRVNDGTSDYYETGAEKSLSLHVSGATLSTLRRIDRYLRSI